jgi:hypothetical protein
MLDNDETNEYGSIYTCTSKCLVTETRFMNNQHHLSHYCRETQSRQPNTFTTYIQPSVESNSISTPSSFAFFLCPLPESWPETLQLHASQ